jgi:uncharacterized DUF497 family protein
VRITYDPAKRAATLLERGLDFEHAAEVFAERVVTVPDRRRDYGEERYLTYGRLRGRMVVVVWTPRGEDGRHIISMRKCNAREQARYRQQLGEGRRDDR